MPTKFSLVGSWLGMTKRVKKGAQKRVGEKRASCRMGGRGLKSLAVSSGTLGNPIPTESLFHSSSLYVGGNKRGTLEPNALLR